MNIIKTALQTLLYFKYRFFDICFLVSGSFHLSTYSTFCCILFGKTRISENSLRPNNLGLWAEASPKHHFITPPQCKQGQVKTSCAMGSWVGGGCARVGGQKTTCWWNKENPRLDSFLVNGRILVVGGNRCKPSFAGINESQKNWSLNGTF